MQLLTVTNTPIALGESPFFQGQDVVAWKTVATNANLEGSLDGSTGWTVIAAVNPDLPVMVNLTYPYIRASASTFYLLNN